LKRLQNELIPYHEVTRLIIEILDSKKGSDRRLLEHLLSFAEHQFGKGVTGKDYRERDGGERIGNWKVDNDFLNEIIQRLVDLYQQDNSLSDLNLDCIIFPYLERTLSLLNPWLTNLDPDSSEGISTLSKEQQDDLLGQLNSTEHNMAIITMKRIQFDLAEGHCQRCLAYSRRYGLEGDEKKTTMMFDALSAYCSLRERQGNYSDALSFAEECYNLVVEAYDPAHPQVQEAAGLLINILIRKGDLFDAERYAQVIYGNLRDKKNGIDQESKAVATGAYNLADVIYQQDGDLIKAEELARESLRIFSLINGSNHHRVGRACSLLANILRGQNQLGDKTRELHERCLSIFIRNEGPDGPNTASVNYNLGSFY
jgi:tetratricopeptide (TPR) repeat protein